MRQQADFIDFFAIQNDFYHRIFQSAQTSKDLKHLLE